MVAKSIKAVHSELMMVLPRLSGNAASTLVKEDIQRANDLDRFLLIDNKYSTSDEGSSYASNGIFTGRALIEKLGKSSAIRRH